MVVRTSTAVVCVGTAALDTIAVVTRLPEPDGRIEASRILTAGGGPAATAAVAMARLGVRVELSAVVGRDAAGDLVIEQLRVEGVGTRFIERREGLETAQSLILVCENDATRVIVTKPAVVIPSVPDGFEWVHVDQAGYQSLGTGPRNYKLSVDDGNPVPGFSAEGIDLYAPTVAVLSQRFPGSLEAAGHAATAAGAGQIVATDGANGSYIFTNGSPRHIPAYPVHAASTLGAGDVFHGALLAGVVQGRPLHDAVRMASTCAAISCRGLDGRSAIPTLTELDEALASTEFTTHSEGAIA
ncbi:carbohydrate kinase family protein [Paenarthrobacter sp. NPDC089714]|uniref:carbohydrate kinase family protein n=1 Tax=Paenarthrobacter sp. NPDC089714 TaxID=3364377 RepID=UPI0037FCB2A3